MIALHRVLGEKMKQHRNVTLCKRLAALSFGRQSMKGFQIIPYYSRGSLMPSIQRLPRMLSKMQAGIANPQTKQTVNLQVQRATLLPPWKRPGLL